MPVQFGGAGGRPITDCIDLEDRAQATLAVSSTIAQTAALAEGVYDVWCDQDVYIGVGVDKSGMTTSTGYLLQAGNIIPVMIRSGSKLAGITASLSATLSYHRIM